MSRFDEQARRSRPYLLDPSVRRGSFRVGVASLLPAAVALLLTVGFLLALAAPAEAADEDAAVIEAIVPGAGLLQRLVSVGMLPEELRDAVVRVRVERSELASPGSVCRRVVAADAPASLVERCRELNQDDDTLSPAAACRRVAAATAPTESLVERCRSWLASDAEPEAGRIAACRRVTASEFAPSDLVQHCRTLLQGGDTVAPESACRRVAASVAPPADLVERCRAWLAAEGDSDDAGRLAACRRIIGVEAAPADLVERCREIDAAGAGARATPTATTRAEAETPRRAGPAPGD
ncbi:MAG: hypothetical protein AB7F65_09735 [Dehalococcoidia bacterium]